MVAGDGAGPAPFHGTMVPITKWQSTSPSSSWEGALLFPLQVMVSPLLLKPSSSPVRMLGAHVLGCSIHENLVETQDRMVKVQEPQMVNFIICIHLFCKPLLLRPRILKKIL